MSDGLNIVKRGSTASSYLNLMRAFAAMIVFLYHTRTTFFVPFNAVTAHKDAVAILYIISSRGYQAVIIFFVLSGYMVGARVLGGILQGTWSWQEYLVGRFTRLYVVLIPALLFTAIWASVDIHVFHVHLSSFNWTDFGGTLFFLQGIFTTHFGHNDPLWSLTYEFWYYILFPSVLWIFFAKSWRKRIVPGALAAAIVVLIWGPILLYFSIWLLGAAVALIPKVKHSTAFQRRIALIATSLLCVGILTMTARWDAYVTMFYPFDILIGLTTALLILTIVGLYGDIGSKITFPDKWAGFSYTLYLTHYPPNITMSYLIGVQSLQPNLRNLGIYIIFIGLILGYAWAIAWCTEMRTNQIRDWLSRRIVDWGNTMVTGDSQTETS